MHGRSGGLVCPEPVPVVVRLVARSIRRTLPIGEGSAGRVRGPTERPDARTGRLGPDLGGWPVVQVRWPGVRAGERSVTARGWYIVVGYRLFRGDLLFCCDLCCGLLLLRFPCCVPSFGFGGTESAAGDLPIVVADQRPARLGPHYKSP